MLFAYCTSTPSAHKHAYHWLASLSIISSCRLIGQPSRPIYAQAANELRALSEESEQACTGGSLELEAELSTTNRTRVHTAKGQTEKERRGLWFFNSTLNQPFRPERVAAARRGNEGFDRHRYFFFCVFFFFFLFFSWKDCEGLCVKMMVGEMEVKERPRPSPDYLMQLLNEKKLMTSLPNLCGIFTHLERLLDEGICVCVWETCAILKKSRLKTCFRLIGSSMKWLIWISSM